MKKPSKRDTWNNLKSPANRYCGNCIHFNIDRTLKCNHESVIQFVDCLDLVTILKYNDDAEHYWKWDEKTQ